MRWFVGLYSSRRRIKDYGASLLSTLKVILSLSEKGDRPKSCYQLSAISYQLRGKFTHAKPIAPTSLAAKSLLPEQVWRPLNL